jgi:saccharopine dehydrogenase (NADP+, L-glutamate forming)/spermidine synthase
MKKILVLGAGMVSKPLVQYLLNQQDYFVKMVSRTLSKAEKNIGSHKNGIAEALDVEDKAKLETLVTEADLVVSLLPYMFHVEVARFCIKHKKHLVTTSYVSDEMRQLDQDAKDTGVILLNEIGLDPGIDHMSAMRIIDNIHERGGKVVSFKSTTGALPAHEANTNPFGYKFSWSPRGVLLASRNPSKWLEDGEILSFPGEQLFENYVLQDVPNVGTFENYPNRNSLPYQNIYGIGEAHTVYRGTFRMVGWCETLKMIVDLGWLSEKAVENFSGQTYRDLSAHLINAKSNSNVVEATAKHLGLKLYSTAIKRLEWLGLFSQQPLSDKCKSPLDFLNQLTMQKMTIGSHEKDMIVMHHEFTADFPEKVESITSTMLQYGIPGGDTSIARTVAYPAAIAVKMILNGEINLTGVHVPVIPEIYNPVLDELAAMEIGFEEHCTEVVK